MEPNLRERELKRAAGLLAYVLTQLGAPVPKWVASEAVNEYASNGESITGLCKLLRSLTPEKRDAIVYNAHDATARDLANWWEEHQAEDRKRETAEAAEAERLRKKKAILDGLNMTERDLKEILE
jgi:hypothetical protein